MFSESSTSLQLKWEKLPAKAGQKTGITAQPEPLVAIGEL